MNKHDYNFIEDLFGGCFIIQLGAYFVVGISVAVIWLVSFLLNLILSNKKEIFSFFNKIKEHFFPTKKSEL